MTHIGECCTCAKFKTPDCLDGIQENGYKNGWNGEEGGCSFWIDAKCKKCKHLKDNGKHNRSSAECAEASPWFTYFDGNGQCQQFAPKVSQTTLEGF